MAAKIIQYQNGMYCIRRRPANPFTFGSYEYFDIERFHRGEGERWLQSHQDGIKGCFTTDINPTIKALVLSGQAEGVEYNKDFVVSVSELTDMNILARTDEGMRNALEQALIYYRLKK